MNALILATLFLFQGQGDVQGRAKIAFDQVKLCSCEKCNCIDCKCSSNVCTCPDCVSKAKSAFAAVKIECLCQNCDCVDCKCTEKCNCKQCNDFQAIYARAIKEQQVVVLKVGKGIPHIDNVPWKQIAVPAITGEKPGYIVGVPKNGQLIRLDFAPNTPRQRIRLDILHVYYPLTGGYVECPTCPQGRIKNTR